jgi:hypothetical protein
MIVNKNSRSAFIFQFYPVPYVNMYDNLFITNFINNSTERTETEYYK